MASRTLTKSESAKARKFLESIRKRLRKLSGGDPDVLFAYRRRIRIRLEHDERGTPVHRRKLKAEKFKVQKGKCAICGKKLPKMGSELHRRKASRGYTVRNTQLIHHKCHRHQQAKRGFR